MFRNVFIASLPKELVAKSLQTENHFPKHTLIVQDTWYTDINI